MPRTGTTPLRLLPVLAVLVLLAAAALAAVQGQTPDRRRDSVLAGLGRDHAGGAAAVAAKRHAARLRSGGASSAQLKRTVRKRAEKLIQERQHDATASGGAVNRAPGEALSSTDASSSAQASNTANASPGAPSAAQSSSANTAASSSRNNNNASSQQPPATQTSASTPTTDATDANNNSDNNTSSASSQENSSASSQASSSSAPASDTGVVEVTTTSTISSDQPTSASDTPVDNVTVISTIQPPSSSSSSSSTSNDTATASSASESSANKSSSSSGIGKSTIIIIVVVASVVGGAIGIWTIIRKVKLSPSSRFDRKLAPMDFSAGRRDSSEEYFASSNMAFARSGSSHSIPDANKAGAGGVWPLHRSESMSSSGHGHQSSVGGGLSRANSAGAAAMFDRVGSPDRHSESGHAGGATMSEAGYAALYPSLPPTSHSHVNPYSASNYGGTGMAPISNEYYNNGVGYSASTRRPFY